MRFILDENLSPEIALRLHAAGHECVHVSDTELSAAADDAILSRAAKDGAVVISQDADFTNLLAWKRLSEPSLLPLRGVNAVTAADIADLVLANLPQASEALSEGAVVSLFPDRMRIRRLPIR